MIIGNGEEPAGKVLREQMCRHHSSVSSQRLLLSDEYTLGCLCVR